MFRDLASVGLFCSSLAFVAGVVGCVPESTRYNPDSRSGGSAGAAAGGSAGAATGGNAGSATGGKSGAATGGNAGSATGGNAGSATGGNAGAVTGGSAGAPMGGDAGAETAGAAGQGVAGSGHGVCPYDDLSDDDDDGVPARSDLCEVGDDALDADEDGVPDACDRCSGDDASGDTDGDGICERPRAGGGYACATVRTSPSGYCMWECDTEASEAMDPGTCSSDPNLPGCCYTCVEDCVALQEPVIDCTRGRTTCRTILRADPDSEDGVYLIDPDGSGGNDPFEAYCDMSRDGGGWTLVAKVNSANEADVYEPRGFFGTAINREQLLDPAMEMNAPPAAHGLTRVTPMTIDDRTVAKFELVNGADSNETVSFYKVVNRTNISTWFDTTEPSASLTCINAGLMEECTFDAFEVRSEPGGTRYALVGMSLVKYQLETIGELHMRIEGDLGSDASGVCSGNADWVGYDTYWGNGLLVWFRNGTD